jgi:S1-C subfamily serine protease
MFRFAISIVSALAGVLAASTAFAAGPYGSIHVGNWNGGAYTDDRTGAFSHCAAVASYNSGIGLVVGQTVAGPWLMAFVQPAWQLTPGETYPIDVTFDGQAQFHLFGTAASPTMVNIALPNNSVIDQLRKSQFMAATAYGQTSQFYLNSTGQLLPTIANCVAKTKSTGVANAGDFSVPVAKMPASNATGKPAATASAAPAAKTAKLVDVNGTGFLINTSGYILTNNHVVSDCVGDIHGNLANENAMKLRIVSADETNDLALLQAPKRFIASAVMRETAVHSGDSIIAIGYPFHGLLTSDFTVTTGIISSLSGILNDTRFLQISAPVQPGNSGGPLLDTSGNVVGVVAAKINAIKFAKATGDIPENINFAIKTGAMRDFLDNSAISYQAAESGTELKAAEIANKARAYTMLISCSANVTEADKR